MEMRREWAMRQARLNRTLAPGRDSEARAPPSRLVHLIGSPVGWGRPSGWPRLPWLVVWGVVAVANVVVDFAFQPELLATPVSVLWSLFIVYMIWSVRYANLQHEWLKDLEPAAPQRRKVLIALGIWALLDYGTWLYDELRHVSSPAYVTMDVVINAFIQLAVVLPAALIWMFSLALAHRIQAVPQRLTYDREAPMDKETLATVMVEWDALQDKMQLLAQGFGRPLLAKLLFDLALMALYATVHTFIDESLLDPQTLLITTALTVLGCVVFIAPFVLLGSATSDAATALLRAGTPLLHSGVDPTIVSVLQNTGAAYRSSAPSVLGFSVDSSLAIRVVSAELFLAGLFGVQLVS